MENDVYCNGKDSYYNSFQQYKTWGIVVLSIGCLQLALQIGAQSPILINADETKVEKTKELNQRSSYGTVHNRFRIQGDLMFTQKSMCQNIIENRKPGLKFVKEIIPYIPRVIAHYGTPLKKSFNITREWDEYFYVRKIKKHPWDLAAKWANRQTIIPSKPFGLGNIVQHLKKASILHADVGYKGTQLKLTLILHNKQKALFKPKWHDINHIPNGEVHGGRDRYNGEIASFYLGCLIGLQNVPITTNRKISLENNIFPVSSKKLSRTFLWNGTDLCFYGVCYYCNPQEFLCDHQGFLEGSISLWLPDDISLSHRSHSWSRKYTGSSPARWEVDAKFCSSNAIRHLGVTRLLDLIELSIFDFLIQNGDRHHYTIMKHVHNSPIIAMDNGKSFGDPYTDHLDILAPLIQCCIIRQKFYEQFVALSGGGLSKALRELLSSEIVELLSEPHFKAIDRRHSFVLATILACKDSRKSTIFM